ncbi:hypothetical protein [Thalassotalea agariperforans]
MNRQEIVKIDTPKKENTCLLLKAVPAAEIIMINFMLKTLARTDG